MVKSTHNRLLNAIIIILITNSIENGQKWFSFRHVILIEFFYRAIFYQHILFGSFWRFFFLSSVKTLHYLKWYIFGTAMSFFCNFCNRFIITRNLSLSYALFFLMKFKKKTFSQWNKKLPWDVVLVFDTNSISN